MYTGTTQQTTQQMIEVADQQLYLAKQQGRNRICFKAPKISEQGISTDEKNALANAFHSPKNTSKNEDS